MAVLMDGWKCVAYMSVCICAWFVICFSLSMYGCSVEVKGTVKIKTDLRLHCVMCVCVGWQAGNGVEDRRCKGRREIR